MRNLDKIAEYLKVIVDPKQAGEIVKRFLFVLTASLLLFFGFQNCSESNLKTLDWSSKSSPASNSIESLATEVDGAPKALEVGEIFSDLVLKYNLSTYTDYRSRSFLSFEDKELHLSFEPKANEKNQEMPPDDHSIFQTISTLISQVPTGQSIHLAFFNLNEKAISNKLIKASTISSVFATRTI